MKLIIVLAALSIISFVDNSYAKTIWLSGQSTDSDGKVICAYADGFNKVYRPAELGGYCPLTADN